MLSEYDLTSLVLTWSIASAVVVAIWWKRQAQVGVPPYPQLVLFRSLLKYPRGVKGLSNVEKYSSQRSPPPMTGLSRAGSIGGGAGSRRSNPLFGRFDPSPHVVGSSLPALNPM